MKFHAEEILSFNCTTVYHGLYETDRRNKEYSKHIRVVLKESGTDCGLIPLSY